jgi:glycosyltransferase involved in cell wall biosynthesis
MALRLARPLPVVIDARVVTGSGGGPDKTILNSPRFLAPLGYRMLCGYLTPPGDPGFAVLERQAARAGAPLIAIPDRGPTDWRIVPKLLKICREENVAIWHGHDYKTNALGLLLNRFWPMRLVTTLHGWVKRTARTPLYYRIDRLCLRHYERVFCVSDDLFEEARRWGVAARKCVLLENGIDTAEYSRRQTTAEAKIALGFVPGDLLIGAVGRLSQEKGFDILLRAVRMLRERDRSAKLVIVGEGDDRTRLETLRIELGLQDAVRFVGWQSDTKPYFEAMDLFALSSLREGLPNVLLEAMALGVPCVATRIAGVPKLIEHGTSGWLVEPGDATALADGIFHLIGHSDLSSRYAGAARRTIAERYDFARRSALLAGAYDELLARAETRPR